MNKLIYISIFFLIIISLGKANPPKGTALVLSGGGARGMAQIGVLRELERQNVKIDYIIGTS
ncbi:hypothetical protein EP342_01745, partial [bacterium]